MGASKFKLHATHEAHSIAVADTFHFVPNPIDTTENSTLTFRIGQNISTGLKTHFRFCEVCSIKSYRWLVSFKGVG